MKKSFLIILTIIYFTSCSPENDNKKIEIDFNNPYIPPTNILQESNKTKLAIIKDADKKPWVIDVISDLMKQLKFDKTNSEISESYYAIMNEYVMQKIFDRTTEKLAYYQEKYASYQTNLKIDNIKKGDVILGVSRSLTLMALDNEDTVHHALLCVATPKDLNDKVFITSEMSEDSDQKVMLVSLNHINQTNDKAVSLRLYYPLESIIEKACEYALKQIGKPYNYNFTEKYREDSFYCSQLVWQAFKKSGLDLDYDSGKYTDYGLVLASDLYKSVFLVVVDYDE